MKNNNEIKDRYPLGKGEVHSSILCGSTKDAHELRAFPVTLKIKSAVSGRTEPKPNTTTRGVSVDFVRLLIRRPKIALRRATDPKLRLAIQEYRLNRGKTGEAKSLENILANQPLGENK
jgi:hypothetical protein